MEFVTRKTPLNKPKSKFNTRFEIFFEIRRYFSEIAGNSVDTAGNSVDTAGNLLRTADAPLS